MARKRGGLINRLWFGSEKSEGYARASLPSNRWELFWDIFKGRFWKLVGINLLMLLFFIPLVALLVFRWTAIVNMGTVYPFSQCFGVGYSAPYSMAGMSETIVFNVNVIFLVLLPVVTAIASLGIAGGAYVIRNMVWTEGIFVANDFWHGIRINLKNMLCISFLFSLVFYFSIISISLANRNIAADMPQKWLFYVSSIFSYVFLIVFSFMTLHMITMSETYELKLRHLIKNSFLFTVGLLPQNVFFAFLGFIPFLLLLLGSFFMPIGVIVILLMGLSLLLLIWTDYCQWAYDRFINDKVEGAKKNRGIYEKVKESNSEALKKYREQIEMTAKSSLSSRPVKPITDDELKIEELPQSFNRNDIYRLNESKQRLIEDNEKYIEEHKNDPEFEQTEADKLIEEKAKEREKRIEAAKKELEKRRK